MQFLTEVEGQFLRPLRFHDPLVLFEYTAVSRVQFVVGFNVAVVAPREAIKFCLVRRYRSTEVDVGMSFDAFRLASLDNNHEGQDHGVALSGHAVGPKLVDWCIDLVLKTTGGLGDRNRRALGLLWIAEYSRVHPREMRKIRQILNHPSGIRAPLTLRRIRLPIEIRIREFRWKLRDVLSRLVEANPDQTMALLGVKRFRSGFRRNFAIRWQRRDQCAAAIGAVIPSVVGAYQLIAVDPTEGKRRSAMDA